MGRETAVTIWMFFYKDERPKGVALLKQQAEITKDPTARQRLAWVAYKATTWCSPSDRAQCDAALNAK